MIPCVKKNFNAGFFLDAMKAGSFKLYLIITLPGFYIFILGLMTLTLLQGYRCARNINCNSRVQDSCPL